MCKRKLRRWKIRKKNVNSWHIDEENASRWFQKLPARSVDETEARDLLQQYQPLDPIRPGSDDMGRLANSAASDQSRGHLAVQHAMAEHGPTQRSRLQDNEGSYLSKPPLSENVSSLGQPHAMTDALRFQNQVGYHLERQSLYPTSQHGTLRMSALLFHTIRLEVNRCLAPRLQPKDAGNIDIIGAGTSALPLVHRSRLVAPNTAMDPFKIAIRNGTEALSEGRGKMATASLEQGFRLLEDVLKNRHFQSFQYITETVLYSRMYKVPQVGQMLLRHIISMATILYGPNDNFTVFCRSLLSLMHTNEVFDAVIEAFVDIVQDTLGPQDTYSAAVKFSNFSNVFCLRDDPGLLQDVTLRYHALLQFAYNTQGAMARYFAASLSDTFADTLVKFGEYERAERLLSDAPSHLHEWRSNGYVLGDPRAPIRITLIIIRLTDYGKILADQQKYEQAHEMFSLAVAAGTEYLGADAPITVSAITSLGKALANWDRKAEADAAFASLDERLRPYMLQAQVPAAL